MALTLDHHESIITQSNGECVCVCVCGGKDTGRLDTVQGEVKDVSHTHLILLFCT